MSKSKGLREQVWACGISRPSAGLHLSVVMTSSPHSLLCLQNLETLDVTKLTPLTPEVISRQATINIGASGPARRPAMAPRHTFCGLMAAHSTSQSEALPPSWPARVLHPWWQP